MKMNQKERVEALKAAYSDWKNVCDRILQAAKEYEIAKAACSEMLKKTAKHGIEEAERNHNGQGPILYSNDEWDEWAPEYYAVAERIIAIKNIMWE